VVFVGRSLAALVAGLTDDVLLDEPEDHEDVLDALDDVSSAPSLRSAAP
jgi:hypothetical protein